MGPTPHAQINKGYSGHQFKIIFMCVCLEKYIPVAATVPEGCNWEARCSQGRKNIATRTHEHFGLAVKEDRLNTCS